LQNHFHKQIVIEALQNRANKKQVTIYGFVIMPNHIHIIWQLHDEINRVHFQRDFLKFTARSILNFMRLNQDPLLTSLKVKAKDRSFQVWERNSLMIDLYTEKVFIQKLQYIHNNPIQQKWRLADQPEKYKFSSANFYETGNDDFLMLTHFRG
jgi:REP element-mobilizing transposase RayT